MAVKYINIDSGLRRGILLGGCLLFLACVYFFAKWELANTVASKSQYKEIAEAAVDLAPSDPQSHYIWANLLEKTFLPEDLPRSLAEYEQSAALSPNNYLYWLALGKARSRSGDPQGAEKALRKAAELAPNYAQIQWTLGNLLLRLQRSDEAFAELRKSAQNDPNYTNPVVFAAWQTFDGDLAQTRRAVGDSPFVNSALAVFLAGQKRFDEAFEVWNSLPADGKKTAYKANGQELFNRFITVKKYLEAQKISAQIAEAETTGLTVGQIFNGGFETDVKMTSPGIFEWQIADAQQPQIGYDTQQKHGGERSLVLLFNSADGRDFRAVSQMLTVEPGKTYDLSGFYKSDLKTTTTFGWEIADADGKILASTQPTDAKMPDWTKFQAKFTASAATEAVTVRLVRVACKTGICPITGKILFDDFTLTKID